MKKALALLLSLAMVMGMAACGNQKESTPAATEPASTAAPTTAEPSTEAPATEASTTEEADIFAKGEGVMTYEEFMNTPLMEPVVIEAFVQGKQAYYAAKGTANVYLADPDGAYYCYGLTLTQEQFDKLEVGTKVKVSGEKAEYAGEIEVGNGVLEEIEEGSYAATVTDVTNSIADLEELGRFMNLPVAFQTLVVVAQDNGEAISKKNSDSDPDIYFTAANANGSVDFCVESYLTGPDTDVYKTAEGLKPGDLVTVEGFLYWYNGANPHVTAIDVVANINEKSEGVMTYAEFMAAALMEPVVIEAYVQNKQAYYEAKQTANLYLADADGAYYCYECSMTKDQYDELEPGTKVKISGEKAEYAGEIEVGAGKVEAIENDDYVAPAKNVTALVGDQEALAAKMNQKVVFKAMVVTETSRKESDSDPDIYFTAGNENGSISFCVESYLTGKDTETYMAGEALKVGDIVDVEGFLYWYNGANPHVTAISLTGNVNDKSEGVMTYEEFMAAEMSQEVVIEAYVQGKQDYYAAKETANLYLADADGAYYAYGCKMTQEQFDQLEEGTKVRISGEKAEWAGEIELGGDDLKLEEILDGKYVAAPVDVTGISGEELAKYMNRKVVFKAAVVRPQDNGAAFSKKDSDSDPDIYFDAAVGADKISFCVESYLTGPDTDVYKAVEGLKVDDKIDIVCFLYWYNAANPHVLAVEPAE